MTLRPATEFGIHGHPGKPYDVDLLCSVPGCGQRSVHAHHLFSRAHLRGEPYEWVELPDGTVVGNRTGLCFRHHEDVTGPGGGHRARVLLVSGAFFWAERSADGAGWDMKGPLDPQPPGVKVETVRRIEQPSEEICPTCGHAKQKREKLPTRKSKTWTVTVPDDTEIGAEILDGWVLDICQILGLEDESSRLRRYHALAVGLAWIVQEKERFARDIAEASERLQSVASSHV